MAFRYPWRFSAAIASTVLAAGFQLFVPQFLGRAVDHAQDLLTATAGEPARIAAEQALLTTALLLVGTSLARGVFTMLLNYHGETLGHLVAYELRLAYYRKLQKLSLSWHYRIHSGELMTLGILDIEGVRVWITAGILRAILLAILIGAGAVILFRIDALLCLAALSFVPVIGIRASIARLKLREAWIVLQEELSGLTKVMEENLGGIRVVRAFAAGRHELRRFDDIAARALGVAHARIALFVRHTTQMTFVYFLAMGLVLWLGGQKTIDGEITLGQLAEFLAFMTILQMPVRQIGLLINAIAHASTCGGRLFGVLDLEPSIADRPGARDLVVTEGVLRFEKVSFQYPAWAKDERTLADIDLEARPGKTIGIVGPPGSGKSTIAHLMGRYYDVGAGRIAIDGQDIRDATLNSLRRAVNVVQQEPFLFTASIDHNVAYGDPWAGRDSIERSAATAQLHNYVASLPTGYGALVGERGVTLSGGQKQRLSIARSVLLESTVLVFDDSTAAVDAATERRIRAALAGVVARRAVVIIAHRLSSLMHADEIVFLERGRIVERGSHVELLALGGRYAELYRLQTHAAHVETVAS
jgi:ATP-binding cassette subfamily B protein